jgi:hypothetical protein
MRSGLALGLLVFKRQVTARQVIALAVSVASCGSAARNDARDSLVKQLESGGLDHKTALCVVDAFFANKTDAELKGFFERPTLTPDEAAEFASLGLRCAPAASTSLTGG